MLSVWLTEEELNSLQTNGYCGIVQKKHEAFQGEVGLHLIASLKNGSSKCTTRTVAVHVMRDGSTLSILVPALPPLS